MTAGDSAGGLLGISLAMSHPDEIRAATAAYPCLDMGSSDFSERRKTPLSGVSVPESEVTDYLNSLQPGAVVSSVPMPERMSLMISAIEYGKLAEIYERGMEKSPHRERRYPMERLDQADVQIHRGGITILHGNQDSVVPVGGSERFVAKARKVLLGKPGGDKVVLVRRDGDHGFDSETSLEEPWLADALKAAVSTWLE